MEELVTLSPYHQKMLVECVRVGTYSFPHLVRYPSAYPVYVKAVSPESAIQQVLDMLSTDKVRWGSSDLQNALSDPGPVVDRRGEIDVQVCPECRTPYGGHWTSCSLAPETTCRR